MTRVPDLDEGMLSSTEGNVVDAHLYPRWVLLIESQQQLCIFESGGVKTAPDQSLHVHAFQDAATNQMNISGCIKDHLEVTPVHATGFGIVLDPGPR